ncbi:SGNH/GDSL hydrolase family protein [Phenylobacterium sp.]|uniref:SGNH/GDSL hydrolase family protein n=1 Tax=Phenylobacterium sp. TaxID=1871053 RepID=UPI002FE345F3
MKTSTAALAAWFALAAAAAAQPAAAPSAPTTPVGIVADPCVGRTPQTDWANLCRYRADNAATPPPRSDQPRVVFMGDSITEGWRRFDPDFFEANGYLGRGISGQTTPQMLVRFQPDVIALKPRVAHLMAATNDIAGNTGPTTLQAVQDNIVAMTTLARANGVRMVLAAVPPAADFPWRKGMEPAPKIAELNAWLKAYAAREGLVFVDYGEVLGDAAGAMRPEFSRDGVHPNPAGYAAMQPLARRAIAEALAGPRR